MTMPVADLVPVCVAHCTADTAQQHEADGSPTWITRGANFVVAVTAVHPGTILSRSGQADDYMVILPVGMQAELSGGGQNLLAGDDSLAIVPPGDSRVKAGAAGHVVRIFSTAARDLTALAQNAAHYGPDLNLPENIAPLAGHSLRQFRMADYPRVGNALIQPRIFRSGNLMVNLFHVFDQLRPTTELRPHWHDDFDQGSLGLAGRWLHHIRTPWGSDIEQWRDDQHLEVASPSLTIIPPTMIHASRNLDPDSRLVDIFAPPRVDFLRSGIVINAAEYPAPPADAASTDRDVPQDWQKVGRATT
ncbi:hypothetical protein [Devosia salina]|uniref:Uncharacterized protein n=1 Tax=Devosia salina TaxID=2860336 RepID=A0ABX8WCC7_9HYPH|nr:hypothetical protein [Devosia salina]QYO75631.1 hypothetical protein K1X15_13425 [Devosia salina]